MEEHDRIELRSDDVQEIIGTPPNWILRWGTFIILAALGVLVAMSFYIQYPDKVAGRVKLTSMTAPARVEIPQSGVIDQLMVKNDDVVQKGELLLVIRDAANYQDVIDLEDMIGELQNAPEKRLQGFTVDPDDVFELGGIQSFYSDFLVTLKDYQVNQVVGIDRERIRGKQRQILDIRKRIKTSQKQLKTIEKQRDLAYASFKTHEDMFNDKAISKQEVDKYYQIYLEKESRIDDITGMIDDYSIQISALDSDIKNIRSGGIIDNNEKFIKLQETINSLANAINSWKKNFLIDSPIDGKISMPKQWSEQSYVKQGDEIMAVLADDSNDDKFIEFLVPIDRSGKIAPEQRVILKFDNYPFREHGTVKAEVIDVDELPRDGLLQVNIKLTNGLVAMKGKELPFSQEMQGIGEIITAKRSVFTRIFENVIKPFMESGE